MRKILHQGLEATAARWPDLRRAFGWVEEAAEILKTRAQEVAEAVKSRYQALLERMREQDATAGTLQGAVEHFLKVTQSYWPGLFHCYDVEGLPRTNNDLEQFFGGIRHYERRTTGRKRASPTLVVRGAVRLVAATISCVCPLTPSSWSSPISKPGRPNAAACSNAVRLGYSNVAFAGSPTSTSLPWRNGSSS
jgi:hypothetical protein